MMEFKILRCGNRVKSKITILNFKRADFDLFKVLLGRVPWDKALEGTVAQESWLIFKGHHLQTQKQPISMSKKQAKMLEGPHG